MEEVGGIVFKLQLDRTQFDRDLAKVPALKPLKLGLDVDFSSLDRQLNRLQSLKLTTLKVGVQVDDRELYRLNRHLESKRTHAKDINEYFKRNPIAPQVDLSGLDALDRRLKSIEQTKVVNVKLNIDARELAKLANLQATVRAATSVSSQQAALPVKPKVDADLSGFEKSLSSTLEKSFKGAFDKSKSKGVGGNLLGIITAPLRAVTGLISDVGGGIASGLLFGVTQELSKGFAKGINNAIEQSFGNSIGSSEFVGRKIASGIIDDLSTTLDKNLPDVGKAFREGLRDVLGVEEVELAAAFNRARAKQQQQSQRKTGTKQLIEERRESIARTPEVQRRVQILKAEEEKLLANVKKFEKNFEAFNDLKTRSLSPAATAERINQRRAADVKKARELGFAATADQLEAKPAATEKSVTQSDIVSETRRALEALDEKLGQQRDALTRKAEALEIFKLEIKRFSERSIEVAEAIELISDNSALNKNLAGLQRKVADLRLQEVKLVKGIEKAEAGQSDEALAEFIKKKEANVKAQASVRARLAEIIFDENDPETILQKDPNAGKSVETLQKLVSRAKQAKDLQASLPEDATPENKAKAEKLVKKTKSDLTNFRKSTGQATPYIERVQELTEQYAKAQAFLAELPEDANQAVKAKAEGLVRQLGSALGQAKDDLKRKAGKLGVEASDLFGVEKALQNSAVQIQASIEDVYESRQSDLLDRAKKELEENRKTQAVILKRLKTGRGDSVVSDLKDRLAIIRQKEAEQLAKAQEASKVGDDEAARQALLRRNIAKQAAEKIERNIAKRIDADKDPVKKIEFAIESYQDTLDQLNQQLIKAFEADDAEQIALINNRIASVGNLLDQLQTDLANQKRTIKQLEDLDKISGQLGVDTTEPQPSSNRNKNKAQQPTTAQQGGNAAQGSNAQLPVSAAKNVPPIIRRLAEESLKAAGLKLSKQELEQNIPSIGELPESLAAQGTRAAYVPAENKFQFNKEALAAIQSGQVTEQFVEEFVHEFRHVMQSAFGKINTNIDDAVGVDLLTPTAEEATRLASGIEFSTATPTRGISDPAKRSTLESRARKLETDAYVFQDRNASQIYQKVAKETASSQLLQTGGVAGEKIKIAYRALQASITQTFSEASAAGLDVSAALDKEIAQIQQFVAQLKPVLSHAADIDSLSLDDIKQVEEKFKESLLFFGQSQERLKAIVPNALEGLNEFTAEGEVNPDYVPEKPKSIPERLAQRVKQKIKDVRRGKTENQLVTEATTASLDDPGTIAVAKKVQSKGEGLVINMTKLSAAASATGSTLRAIVDGGRIVAKTLHDVADSTPVQALASGVNTAVRALEGVAKAGYAVASGAEGLVLDALPFGRTAKAVGQQVALPALAFGAATQLPGVGVAADVIQQIVSGAAAPAIQALAGSASASAGGAVSSVLPGFGGIAASVGGAVTTAVNTLLVQTGEMAVQAATVVIGGRMLTTAAGKALPQAAETLKNITSAEPVRPQLPQANRRQLGAAKPKALPASTIDESTAQPVTVDVMPVEPKATTKSKVETVKPTAIVPTKVDSELTSDLWADTASRVQEAAQSIQVEVLKDFNDYTRPQLLAAARKLGIQGVSSKTTKDDLIRRLESKGIGKAEAALKEVEGQVGRDGSPVGGVNKEFEKGVLKQVAQAEKKLNKQIESLSKLQGKKYQERLNQILTGIEAEIAEIDRLKGEGLSGDTIRSLSATQGRLRNTANNNTTLVDARAERINIGRSAAQEGQANKVKGLARVVPAAEEEISKVTPAFSQLGRTLQQVSSALSKLTAKAFAIQPQPTLAGTIGAAAKSERGQDLIVNAAGFAASQIGQQFGIIPELGGDLGGALVARQALNVGRAGVQANRQLKQDPAFAQASKLQRLKQLAALTRQNLLAQNNQRQLGRDLTGDLAGFTIGNAVAKGADLITPALDSIAPGVGALAQLPMKGAIAASLTVPKIVAARDKMQGQEQGEVSGLARVAPSAQGMFERTASLFKSLLPSNEKRLKQIQGNFEAIFKEIANASKAAFDPRFIPTLSVDPERLKKMGAQAYYDLEQNAILIDKELEKILAKSPEALAKFTEQLKALTHEGRHSLQTMGGKLSVEDAAQGQAIDLIDESILTDQQRRNVQGSVDLAAMQGASPSQQEAVRKLEADATAFEEKTPKLIANVAATSKPDAGLLAKLKTAFAQAQDQAISAVGKVVGQLKTLLPAGVSKSAIASISKLDLLEAEGGGGNASEAIKQKVSSLESEVDQIINRKIAAIEAEIAGIPDGVATESIQAKLQDLEKGIDEFVQYKIESVDTPSTATQVDTGDFDALTAEAELARAKAEQKLARITQVFERLGSDTSVVSTSIEEDATKGDAISLRSDNRAIRADRVFESANINPDLVTPSEGGATRSEISTSIDEQSAALESLTAFYEAGDKSAQQALAAQERITTNLQKIDDFERSVEAKERQNATGEKAPDNRTFVAKIKDTFQQFTGGSDNRTPFGNAVDTFSEKFGALKKNIGAVVGIFAAFQAAQFATQQLQQLATEAVNAAIKLESLKTSLSFSSGGSAGAAKTLEFIRSTADELGTPLAAAREGFTQLSAATKNTALEGQATKDTFLGIQKAASVLGLSTDQTSGALLALTQIASKGKVQAEELRGQLGERIPGAFQIAAKAMNVTEGELNKMLELGQVTAGEFLPAFARQLEITFGGAAVTASQDAQSAIFRLQNAFIQLQESAGQALLPFVTGGAGALTKVIDLAAIGASRLAAGFGKVFHILGVIFGVVGKVGGALAGLPGVSKSLEVAFSAIAIVLGSLALQGVLNLGKALIGLLPVAGSLSETLATIPGILLNIAKTLLPMIGRFLLLQVAVEMVSGLFKAFVPDELTSSFDKATNSMVANLERVSAAARKARGDVESIPDSKKGTEDDLPSEGIDIGSALSFGAFSFKTDDLIKIRNAASGLVTGKLGLGENFGRIKTQAEKQFEDQQVAASNLNRTTNQFVTDTTSGRISDGKGGSLSITDQLRTVAGIDKQIATVANRRKLERSKSEPDKDALKQLDGQLSVLQDDRKRALQPITEQKSIIESSRKDLQDQIGKINNKNLPEAAKKRLRSPIEEALKGLDQAESQINKFEDGIKSSASAARELSNVFLKTAAALEEAVRQAQALANTKTARSIEQQLKTFTTDQLGSQKAGVAIAKAEQESAQTQFDAQRKASEDQRKALESDAAQSILAGIPSGTSGQQITIDSSIPEIDAAIAAQGDKDSQEKDTLKQLKAYKEGLAKLTETDKQLQSAKLASKQAEQALATAQLDLAATQRQTKSQLSSNVRVESNVRGQLKEFGSKADPKGSLARSADLEIQSAKNGLKDIDDQTANAQKSLEELKKAQATGKISAEEFAKRERELTLELSDLKVKKAQQELAVKEAIQKKALALIEREAQEAENAIRRTENRAQAGVARERGALAINRGRLARQRAGNQLSEADANVASADLGIREADNNIRGAEAVRNSANDRLISTRAELDALNKAYQEGRLQADEYYKRSEDLQNRLSDGSRAVADAQAGVQEAQGRREEALAAKVEATNRKIIEGLDFANRRAEAAINLSQTTQTTAIRSQLLNNQPTIYSGDVSDTQQQLAERNTQSTQNQVDLQTNQVEAQAIQDRIALKQKELKENRQLVQSKVRSAKEGTETEIRLQQELADLNASALDKELNGQKLIQDQLRQRREIEKQLKESRERLEDATINYYQKLAALEQESLDRQSKLLAAQNDLNKARNEASTAGSQAQLGLTDKALDLRKQLRQEDLDPAKRQALTESLNKLGFTTADDELDILKKKQEIEDEIARKKAEALAIEQEFQRQSLEIEIRKNRLAAENLKFEAQKAKIQAQRDAIQAKKDFKAAQERGDVEGMQLAQDQLDLAGQAADLADRQYASATQSATEQENISNMQRQALQLRQGGQIQEAYASERIREVDQSLAGVDTALQSGLSPNRFNNKDSGALSILNNANTEIIPPISRQSNDPYRLANLYRAGGAMPPMQDYANADRFNQSISRSQSFTAPQTNAPTGVSTAMVGNQQMQSEIARLNANITQLANSPRNLTVSSPTPVQDAGKIYRNISNNRTTDAGL